MANIRKRISKAGKVSYQIRVFRGTDSFGKQLPAYTMTYTPKENMTEKQIAKEVNRTATLFEEQCKQGVISLSKKTFSDYAQYVIDLKENQGLKHSTVLSYKSILKRINDVSHGGFGYMKLTDIKAEHLNKYYIALSKKGNNKATGEGLSAKTILEQHRFISSVLECAYREELVTNNVARRGEILGIKWHSVDFENNTVHLCNNLLYSADRGTKEMAQNFKRITYPLNNAFATFCKKIENLNKFNDDNL